MTQITFKSVRGTKVTVNNGETSPVLSGGAVTWDTVVRPKRVAITRYAGRSPWKQDLAIMFDGLLDRTSQEGDIAKLVRMSTQANIINLEGHALMTDLDWVFNDSIDWDDTNVVWERIGTERVRLRQAATVHLIEYISDTVIETPAAPTVAQNKPTVHVPAASGMTLKAISIVEYGDPDKWVLIRDANPILIAATARTVVPAGATLTIPEPKGAVQYFTVP